LAACAGYAAAVLYTADAREAGALATSFAPHWPWWGQSVMRFEQGRQALAGIGAGLAGLGVALALNALRKGQFVGWQDWLRRGLLSGRRLGRAWRTLAPGQRRLAFGLLALLTALRVLVSRRLATFDDAASYEFFVRKSLLVVSAYYPAPNNHVLSNTLSWLFYQVYPGYWWSMRVPVLLLSTAGTAAWFLGLLRRSNFRVATFATLLFSLLELSLFYTAEGRGYALLFTLSTLGFFCTLDLAHPSANAAPKVAGAWLGLAAAGILGLYTVPTFAYFLVAAYSWLGVCGLRSANYRHLLSLGLLGGATLLGAALLYAPLLAISGSAALLHNAYVQPLIGADFLRQLPAHWWEVEGALMGESHNGVLASVHLGSLTALAVLVGFGALVGAARLGRLPARRAAYTLGLGVPALWFALVPYSLLLVQHVLPPTRTLWTKAAFMFLLAALVADWLWRWLGAKSRLGRPGLLLAMGLWTTAQLIQLYRSNELRLSYLRTPHAVARWLLQQPPGPVLCTGSVWNLAYVQFFIHVEQPTSTLALDGTPRPGVRYRYRIDPPATQLGPTPLARPRLHLDQGVNNAAMNVAAYW
jgi:hypothetical protein